MVNALMRVIACGEIKWIGVHALSDLFVFRAKLVYQRKKLCPRLQNNFIKGFMTIYNFLKTY